MREVRIAVLGLLSVATGAVCAGTPGVGETSPACQTSRGKPVLPLDGLLRARQQHIDELHRLEPGRTALLVIECGLTASTAGARSGPWSADAGRDRAGYNTSAARPACGRRR